MTLGTATPGGGFPVYGQAVADTVNEVDPSLEMKPQNTKGSTENVPMLEAGTLDLALVQGEVAHEAWAGIGRAPAALRLVAAMYSTAGMFVVRADAKATRIQDLVGQPVAFGAQGSGLVILARYVLDGLGLDRDRDFKAVFLERAGDGPAMVLDGRVAALWGGGLGWPGFTAVAKAPGGARFIVPDLDGIRRIQAKHPFLKLLMVPANSYPGPDRRPRLGRLVELHPRAPDPARRGRLPRDPRAAPGRGRPRRAPAPGARDDRRQHRPRRAEPRPAPPGHAPLPRRGRTPALALTTAFSGALTLTRLSSASFEGMRAWGLGTTMSPSPSPRWCTNSQATRSASTCG